MNIKGIQQHFTNTWSIGIVHALALVELAESIHFIRGQFKVKELGIGLDPGFVDGLREDDDPQLVFVA